MGVWASGTTDIKRHSTNGQSDAKWRMDTDTLRSRSGAKADVYQYHLKLMSKDRSRSPVFTKVSMLASNSSRHGTRLVSAPLKSAWGDNLRVPARSQMIYKNGGEVWCSPTSLSMVMAYWSNKTGRKNLNQSVPTVARGTYDSAYRGWGNWPFNTAYASAHGLESTVSRFSSIEQVERWIDMGVPVVSSVAWDNRSSGTRLSGAPLQRSGGHLMIIKGFTPLRKRNRQRPGRKLQRPRLPRLQPGRVLPRLAPHRLRRRSLPSPTRRIGAPPTPGPPAGSW